MPGGRGSSLEAPATATTFADAVLVRQVQAGKVHAYADLVRKYQDRVYNVCWRICGSTEDAADLTQEAFLKALEAIDSFRGRSSFFTWIFRIAVNLARTHQRKASCRRAISLDGSPPAKEGDPAGPLWRLVRDERSPDPAAAAAGSERRRQVALALTDLEEDYRVVIVLRDVEGLDYQEIADTLELPVGTVKSRIHRGRLALREILKRYGVEGLAAD